MQIEERKEQLAETQRIREKYNIVCKVSNTLNFKDFMMLKTPESGFYFEYKKHRTTMLKVKEPPQKGAILQEVHSRTKRARDKTAKGERKRGPQETICALVCLVVKGGGRICRAARLPSSGYFTQLEWKSDKFL